MVNRVSTLTAADLVSASTLAARPHMDVRDEAPLVRALAEGSGQALRQVYEDHHAHVRTFAQRLVGEEAASRDLVHEVFVRLPRAARGFRRESSLRSFLISMVINHARNHV